MKSELQKVYSNLGETASSALRINGTTGGQFCVFAAAGTQHLHLLLGRAAVPVGLVMLDITRTTV